MQESFTYPSSDGIHSIYTRVWIPEQKPRAIVQIVHGVAEHIERYDAFATYLAERGFLVVGDDHLGHGKSVDSPDELGWFAHQKGWDFLVEDERILHDIIREKIPDLPFIVLGHSMGSFITRTILIRYPDLYDACILSGTGHQPIIICESGKRIAGLLVRLRGSKHRSSLLQNLAFGGYFKRIENPIGEHDWISTDAAVIQKFMDDPLCGYRVSCGLMKDMLEGMSIIARRKNHMQMKKDLPILFVSGMEDPVGNYGKGVLRVRNDFDRAGMKHTEMVLYDGMRHEVLNEIEKEKVWSDLLQWLENRIEKL